MPRMTMLIVTKSTFWVFRILNATLIVKSMQGSAHLLSIMFSPPHKIKYQQIYSIIIEIFRSESSNLMLQNKNKNDSIPF